MKINSKKPLTPTLVIDHFSLILDYYLYCSLDAINACPPESTEELSQFYQNRAAAWESLVYRKIYFELSSKSHLFVVEKL